ncbi:MAG: dienelactone hydrolase family protein, partial [Gemmatimonadaceae bacterium]
AFEAFAWTYPVWNTQDSARGRAALRSLAPTRAARRERARTPRERAWLDAVESLYDGDTPKAVRDTAFSLAMARLHASDARDPEAATFYALSLLGLNQGEREPRAYAAAEAIVDTVLRANPRHPGAVHYKIHAVDDPENAARGLTAARVYGDVAPSAGHALHMTSHIYMSLGMWDDVVAANRRAQATNHHVFGHGTHWLVYGLLQQGRTAEARGWVDSMLTLQREVSAGAAAVRGVGDVNTHAILIPATYVIDAEAWDTPLARYRADTTDVMSVVDRSSADFLVGYAAARRAGRPVDVTAGSRASDRLLADSMLARMAARHAAARASTDRDDPAMGRAEVMEEVLRAELLAGSARVDSAIAVLRLAATRLESLPFAFGPPQVIKPPRERAGELLLFAGRPAEALAEFDLALRMTPGRTQVRLRRARALQALGRVAEATKEYAAVDRDWRGSDATFPFATEARWGGGRLPDRVRVARLTSDTVVFSSGSLALRGVLWRPIAPGPYPGLVVLHGSGGCWARNEVQMLGQTLAARGYVAFFPCRRGQGLSAGQGVAVLEQLRREGLSERDSAFSTRSTELLVTTQLADVSAAIVALRARAEVDRSRVAVTGVSYGGILTLLAAEADSTLRAAVAFAPAAMNWGWNAPLRERLTSGVRRTRVPVLVLQAENDWNVGPTDALPAAMRAAGGEGTGRLYPAIGGNANEGHGLMVTSPALWEDDVFTFLEQHLGKVRTASTAPSRF